MRALRAQISPHFIYNSLGAIASLRAHRPRPGPRAAAGVRRLHPLLLPPARRVHDAGRGAPLDRALPAARAGPLRRPAPGHAADRARGAAGRRTLPLHPAAGRERRPARARGRGRAAATSPIVARDLRPRVRDRGRGRRRRARTPSRYAARSPATPALDSVGLGNVDARLRNAFGDDYGLVVETAPGAGTKVIVRVPEVRARGARHDTPPAALRVLVIDDERPALDELAFLLERDAAGRRGAHLRLRHRGAADAAGARGRRGLPRHPDARADRARAGPGARPLPDAAAGRVRHRPRGARGRRLRAATPSTTSSSRCAPSGSPRRYAGWSRAPARRRPATTSRSRSSAAGSPASSAAPTSATSRRRATTPGCTPPTTPTWSGRR